MSPANLVPYPGIRVTPSPGQSVSVSIINAAGNGASAFLDPFGVSSAALPYTVSVPTILYLAGEGPWLVNGVQVTLEGAQVATVDLSTPAANLISYGDKSAVYLTNPKYGAKLNGNNDDAALAAATLDVPKGGKLVLPGSLIGFSTWSPRADIHVQGAGYRCIQNAAFADSGWATSNYGTTIAGTVLASTATSGTAVTIADTVQDTSNGSFVGVMILGPGTGTSTGLAVGGAHFNAPYGNLDVMVANFDNGVTFTKVESSTFASVRIRGCGATGYSDDGNTTNNLFNSLEVQFCVNGIVVSGAGNTFIEPLLQNISGQPLNVSGNGNCFITPWLESSASSTRSAISGGQGIWMNGRAGFTNDVPNISGGSNLILSAVSDGPAAFNISGNSNVLVGTFGSTPVISGAGNVILTQASLTLAVLKGVSNLLQVGSVGDAADLTFQIGDGKDSVLKLMRGGTEFLQVLAAAGGGSGLNNEYVLDLNGSTKRPLLFRHNVSGTTTVPLQITSTDSVTVGLTAPATNATDGFPYIAANAGAPTGTPTSVAGFVPMYYDTTNHKIWFYDGTWKGVVVA